MAEFIFDLQRFDGDGGGGSGSGAGSGGGSNSGGSNSGGSNSGDATAKTSGKEVPSGNNAGKDNPKRTTPSDLMTEYSTTQINTFTNEAYALSGTVAPDQYYSTTAADAFYVSGLNNNIIYDTDRFDNITFADTNLESLANFQYTELDSLGNGRYDLLFDTGTITSIYSHDNQFSPRFTFANGLNEIYSPMVNEWFTAEELQASPYYLDELNWYVGTDYYVNSYGIVVDSSDLDAIEVDVYDVIPLSRAYNNLVTNVDWNDDIVLTDTRIYKNDISSVNASEGTINILYNDGTGTVVKYDGTFSPRFYLSDYSNGIVYNSKMGAWRTIDQAWADSAQYEAEKATFEANFNKIYSDVGKYDHYSRDVSRFENTLLYDGNPNTELFLNDATTANILNVESDDDADGDHYLNVLFDTGAVARVEYSSDISPIFRLADNNGDFVYDVATSTFCRAYVGSYETSDGYLYFTDNDVFQISRENDSFVTKVTANDDIYLIDATAANITDCSKDGVLNFDTGATLRFKYWSAISPVLHFGDGTQMAYNWIDDQWGAALDSTEGVAETFYVSGANNTFVRNADQVDNIYFTDATLGNVVDIHVDFNYINLRFDTGASTAVKYEDYVSPEFTFADGTQYYYNLDEEKWQTPAEVLASGADLLDDPVVATSADTTLSDIIAAPVAVDFGAESDFDIASAGEFVLTAATNQSTKNA